MLCFCLLVAQFFGASIAADAVVEYKNLLRDGDNFVMGGRSKYDLAVASYTKAAKLQPGETQALLRRAEVHCLMKKYRESERDLKQVLDKEPQNKRALDKLSLVYLSIGELEFSEQSYSKLIQVYQTEGDEKKVESLNKIVSEIVAASQALKESVREPKTKSESCIPAMTTLIERVKDSIELIMLRAECAVNSSQHDIALNDLRKLAVMAPSNTKVLFLQALQYKSLGAIEQTKNYIKRCFSIDPENKNCHQLNKELKNSKKRNDTLEKYIAQKNWSNVVSHISKWIKEATDNSSNVLYEAPSVSDLKHKQCNAHFELRETKEGLLACSEALSALGDAPIAWEIHLLIAELHAQDENFQAAAEELEVAKRIGGNQQKIHEFASKLEKLKQQASKKNYYKILGVPKNASKKSIRKAFRALALKYHPDKVTTENEAERERLAAVYRDINEAKEVLLDDEKRARYDQGEDVFGNNSQAQQQQPDPFSQFMNGGFRFHFN